jgi:hypothetical protein
MNRMLQVLTVSFGLVFGLPLASATTYWISTTGSDAADGLSPTTAWATWSHADSIAVSGDTVRVLTGTYTLDTPGQLLDCIITSTPGVTWISDTPLGAKIVCQAGGNNGGWRIQGHDSIVKGFDLTLNNTGSSGIFAYTGGDNVQILHNYVHDIPLAGNCSQFGDGISNRNTNTAGILIDGNLVVNVGGELKLRQYHRHHAFRRA